MFNVKFVILISSSTCKKRNPNNDVENDLFALPASDDLNLNSNLFATPGENNLMASNFLVDESSALSSNDGPSAVVEPLGANWRDFVALI